MSESQLLSEARLTICCTTMNRSLSKQHPQWTTLWVSRDALRCEEGCAHMAVNAPQGAQPRRL